MLAFCVFAQSDYLCIAHGVAWSKFYVPLTVGNGYISVMLCNGHEVAF